MTIGELLRANPRVSLPIEIGAKSGQIDQNMEIRVFLEKVRKRLG
jgi:hypothetical protein